MTRRKRQDLAPSLFPFLAVLVCTLGTLILLLALVSQNTATTAEEQARSQMSQKAEAIVADREMLTKSRAVAMIDEATFHIETIEAVRDQQAAALEQRRDQLTHLEDHIERLKKDLHRLNSEITLASSDGKGINVDAASLVLLQEQIEKEELEIQQLRAKNKNETPRVVIVPHKGPNGTTRRPIYIECTDEGLVIWPEGVKIETEQLKNRRTRSANPLDAALRVARLHIMKVYGDADPPYPLLVVRPHGTDAYFQATAAMQDWDDQYGYEMLDDGIELEFGTADANLKRRLEQAIRRALARQADRRTARAIPLSASKLSRDGNSRGFRERPEHGYSSGSAGNSAIDQQVNRLDDIYREAADELRTRDSLGGSIGSGEIQTNVLGAQAKAQNSGQAGDQDADGNSNQPIPSINGSSDQNEPRSNLDFANTNRNHAKREGNSGDSSESCENCENGDRQTAAGERKLSAQDESMSVPDSMTPPDSERIPDANMVHRDGDNWALPRRVANARGIAIVRTIRVQFFEDRFVVPATRGETAKVIPISGNLDRATLQLATVLRNRISRWGAAMDNGRWEPKLEVEVMGNAGDRLDELKAYLGGSGIMVNERLSR